MSYEAHISFIRNKIDILNIKGIKPKEVCLSDDVINEITNHCRASLVGFVDNYQMQVFGIPVSRVDGKDKIIVGI